MAADLSASGGRVIASDFARVTFPQILRSCELWSCFSRCMRSAMELPVTDYSQIHSLVGGSRRAERWLTFDGAYRPVVLAWCQRRGLQAVDAADVTQDIFLKLPEKISTFDESKAKFRSWLKTVVQNAVTDF